MARALDSWLPTVINAVEPWVSSRGLAVGLQWNQQLDKELDDTMFGIIVVTPWNQHSQWLNFEAGALSKRVGGLESRVAPLLIDFPNMAQLTGPLASYQAVLPTKDGIRSLVSSINDALGVEARDFEKLGKAFDVCWPSLEESLAKINKEYDSEEDPATAPSPQPKSSDDGDMLSEILTAVRSLARSDARLSSDIRNNVANAVDLKVVGNARRLRQSTQSSGSSRLQRIHEKVSVLDLGVTSVSMGGGGGVTVTTSRPLDDDDRNTLVKALDWEDLGIKSMRFRVEEEPDTELHA